MLLSVVSVIIFTTPRNALEPYSAEPGPLINSIRFTFSRDTKGVSIVDPPVAMTLIRCPFTSTSTSRLFEAARRPRDEKL